MNITYVVNSNFSFYEKSTKVLFDSIDKIDPTRRNNFTVIVGESPYTETKYINSVKHCFVEYGGIDFTAAYYIACNQDQFKGYVFYTHDTVYMGPNFFNLVTKNFRGIHYKRLRTRWGMNIGLFRKDTFIRYKNILETLIFKKFDEETKRYYKVLGTRYEDIICRMVDDDSEIFEEQHISDTYQINDDEQYYQTDVDIYNTGVLRNIIYIPELDFYKIKANIGSIDHDKCVINL